MEIGDITAKQHILSNLSLKICIARLSCSRLACDWMMGRKRSYSDSIQLTGKWGTGGDNVATRHYYYCVMCGSCIGMDYDCGIDVVAVAKPV